MVAFLTTIHILASFIMILVVLLQSGKSADLAGAFGGGGSQTAFGPRGAATLLSKITTTSAVIFMLTSISLAILASKRTSNSVLEGAGKSAPQQSLPISAPTTPAPVPQSTPPQTTTPAAGTAPGPATKTSTPTIEVTVEKGGKPVSTTKPQPMEKSAASEQKKAPASDQKSAAPEKKQ